MSEPTTERFTFTRGGDRLVGTLYLPADRPVAAVVTTGPAHVGQGAGHRRLREGACRSGASPRSPSTTGRSARARASRASSRTPEGKAARRQRRGHRARRPTSGPAASRSSPSASAPAAATWPGRSPTTNASRAFAGVAGYYSDAARVRRSRHRTSTRRRSTAVVRPSSAGERPAWPRRSRPSRPTAATWRCRCARRTSSTARPRGGRQLHQRLRRPVVRVHDAVRRPGSGGPDSGAVPPRPFRARPRPAARTRVLRRGRHARSRSCGWSRRVRSTSTTIPASSAPPPTRSLTGSQRTLALV